MSKYYIESNGIWKGKHQLSWGELCDELKQLEKENEQLKSVLFKDTVYKNTESKRYQLRQEDLDYPIYSDLVDTEDNDRVICTFNNDSGTNKMVVLLNNQDQRIKELESELELYKHHVEFIPSSEW